MCTFQDHHTVLVCDVAISQVRSRLAAVFGEAVQYTPVEGHGTLVQVQADVASEPFQAITRAAIAEIQGQSASFEGSASSQTNPLPQKSELR